MLPGHVDAWGFEDKDTRDSLREGAALYFKENRGSVSSAGTLWEAFRAVLRRQEQALIEVTKKESQLKCAAFARDVVRLEEVALTSGIPSGLREIATETTGIAVP
ncbi:hypothetical protein NDU88_005973 [Pleurodeles waltl]|uniref:Uncharacterized protein n=1 Tax=Pleurodeles waltl TaxID=8319 RepID=A0AAV7PIE0_PLEWA|nr:hypothetical protein NDU88_005973 [Pleurodeles waltl]